MIATGALKGLLKAFSPNGTSFWPPRHPKWRDVNLAATVPGWTRWSVADEMLKRVRPTDATEAQVANSDFSQFLKDKSFAAANLTPEQRDALLREFLRWREKRGATQR